MGGVHGISVGLSFMGGKDTDAQVLSYAFAYEQHSLRRLEPQYLKNAEAIPFIAEAMQGYNKGGMKKH
jgi:amidase